MFIIREIYFDTETSGLDCCECKIIELAMLVVEDGEIVEEYDKFINIEEKLSPKITEITGISDEMLQSEGVSEKEVANDLKERLISGTLMYAHNAQFDLSFIYHLLERHFPHNVDDIVEKLNWLDTLTVLKDRKEYPHKLIDAVEYYSVEKVNFHRAIDDTKALYEVTCKLKEERNDLEEYVDVFGYNPKYGISGHDFDFIVYKPQKFTKFMVSPQNILPNK